MLDSSKKNILLEAMDSNEKKISHSIHYIEIHLCLSVAQKCSVVLSARLVVAESFLEHKVYDVQLTYKEFPARKLHDTQTHG